MAGRRQHHVWQMLQRGFSQLEYNEHHVWVYRKGVEPKRTVTKKFGRENYFYGPEGSDADTNITEFENSVQGVIQEARSAKNGTVVNAEEIAPIVSHLEIRSSFLRLEISSLGKRILQTLEKYLSSPKHSQELLTAYYRNHPEVLEDALDEAGFHGEMREMLVAMLEDNLPSAIKGASAELTSIASLIFSPLIQGITETAKGAHKKSLEGSFTEIERTETHKKLQYTVCKAENGRFILPDTCLCFFKWKGCSPISQKGDVIESVVMPISTQVCIIGQAEGSIQRAPETINKALASCSFEAFLAEHMSDHCKKLSSRIGRNARLMSEAEIRKILRFRDLLNI